MHCHRIKCFPPTLKKHLVFKYSWVTDNCLNKIQLKVAWHFSEQSFIQVLIGWTQVKNKHHNYGADWGLAYWNGLLFDFSIFQTNSRYDCPLRGRWIIIIKKKKKLRLNDCAHNGDPVPCDSALEPVCTHCWRTYFGLHSGCVTREHGGMVTVLQFLGFLRTKTNILKWKERTKNRNKPLQW